MGGMCLELGVDVTAMTGHELLDRHNEAVRAMEEAARHEHVAVEIPVGRPKLRYSTVAGLLAAIMRHRKPASTGTAPPERGDSS